MPSRTIRIGSDTYEQHDTVLGSGGEGAVYLGRRTSVSLKPMNICTEPVKDNLAVAIKIVKPGFIQKKHYDNEIELLKASL